LTLAEVSARLPKPKGIDTIRLWINKGLENGIKLPQTWVANTPVVKVTDLDEFLQKVAAAKQAKREARRAARA
jgi:hypothetical protein